MDLDKEATDIFLDGHREAGVQGFHSGYYSELYRIVEKFVIEHGPFAVEALKRRASAPIYSYEGSVIAEICTTFGHMGHATSKEARLAFFESFLSHTLVEVRDAAICGLECLDDPAVLPMLKKAAENEKNGWLKDYTNKIIAELENE
jgi:hypothetical protein